MIRLGPLKIKTEDKIQSWRSNWMISLSLFGLIAPVGTLFATNATASLETSRLASRTRVLTVGAQQDFRRIADAIRAAAAGDEIVIDPGTYRADVALITQNDLKIRARDGRVRIEAMGSAAESKGIFVVRASNVEVRGIDFSGAQVRDLNGAGIRLEAGSLRVLDCGFFDNQNGILTSNDNSISLVVENSEFARNGAGDGQSHQLYAGKIARLLIRGSYFHHAKVGHLLKSRAAMSLIEYNRLTDEVGGQASYELEFPNGGQALVLGNIIEQSSSTQNSVMVSYGAEGYEHNNNQLLMAHNTLVDDKVGGGTYLSVRSGASRVWAYNNLLVGNSKPLSAPALQGDGNLIVDWDQLAQANREDYRLLRTARSLNKAVPPSQLPVERLRPTQQYKHPREVRPLSSAAMQVGALQDLAP